MLTNTKGMQVAITNYGGRVVSLWAPDRNGEMGDVVLGFDDLNGYLGKSPYFGALRASLLGRVAGTLAALCGSQSEDPGPAD
jgi:aldose 1-epimerase